MHRRIALTVVAAASAVTLVAACGSSSSGGGGGSAKKATNQSSVPPKTELVDAAKSLYNGSTLTTTLSLDATGADITHIAGLGPDPSHITPAQASAIAGAHIVVEDVAPSGQTLAQARLHPSESTFSFTGGTGSTTYFTVRVVGRSIYLQIDLKGLLGIAGESSEYETLQTRTASLPAFVKALIAGKWVSLPFSTLSSLESLLQIGSGGKIPTTTQSNQLLSTLATTIGNDLAVSRTSSGTTDQLLITGDIRPIARDVLASVKTALPQLAAELKSVNADQVPDQTFKINAFVVGGSLSKVSIDIGQFPKLEHFSLPVQATFVKSGAPITAPTDATAVDPGQLGQLFSTATRVATSTGTASAPSPALSAIPVSPNS